MGKTVCVSGGPAPQHPASAPLPTLSSAGACGPRLPSAVSTRARRPESESRRLTTLSRSPTKRRYLSNSPGVQRACRRVATSSPSAPLALMSSCSPRCASRSTASLRLRLSISCSCWREGVRATGATLCWDQGTGTWAQVGHTALGLTDRKHLVMPLVSTSYRQCPQSP